ncbi:MAG: flagellar biosynthesis protein FlhF, partial [Gammaproteobacteria bacterium]|nr:flagellar biosynthesis protein FlhF [Gammaproteobacteria bacterium]
MKVRRYHAPTMRQALEQVRSEQGPDVIILSNRKLEDGVELITALEGEEIDFAAATPAPARSVEARPTARPAERPEALDDALAPAPAASSPAPALWTDEGLVSRMQEEMKNLRS